MTRFYKVNSFGCVNTAKYIRIETPAQAEYVERRFGGMADEGKGYAEWTTDRVAGAPGVAIAFDDIDYVFGPISP